MFSTELPKPILFHPLKHHLGFITDYILRNTATPVPVIRQDLLTLGSSQLDLYCGPLPPEQVSQEVILYLQAQKLLTPDSFKNHLLAAAPNYRCITLSDTTDWVLQWGVVAERFVHLHPARYAAYTRRVKATALKTAITMVMASERLQTSVTDLSLINHVRKEWLGLAPIKSFSLDEGAGKIVSLLRARL